MFSYLGASTLTPHLAVYTEQEKSCYQLHAGFFLSFLFDTEDGGGMLLRNVS
jgi:hypothetical protein